MSPGPKKMNPDIHLLFLSTVTLNEPPPGSPTGPPWRKLSFYRNFFLNISQIPHKKFPKINTFFPYLKGPRKGASLHVPQKRGPDGNRCPFPEPYLACLSGSPINGHHSGFPHRAASERDVPLLESCL